MVRNVECPSFMPAALIASGIGTWEYDVLAGRFYLDSVASKLMGVDPDDGLRGLPEVTFLAAINPIDRAKGLDNLKLLLREGGVFVFEHRVNPQPNVERWLLARGRYDKNEDGVVARGRGIMLDISHLKAGGYVGGTAVFAEPVQSTELAFHERSDAVDTAHLEKSYVYADEGSRGVALLEMAEHLIAAHRVAKNEYDDEATTALVAAAMFHVGERLKAESNRK